jgi:uncharacterized membrane protein YeaQ/YmgE (transglycosylase-associated protein family)/membrane protease subunit (stomatin/prohibitin family)
MEYTDSSGIIAISLVIYLVVGCLIGYFAQRIAKDKGYYSGGYFWLGFFLGLIGIVIAACLSDQNKHYSPQYPASSAELYNERSVRERATTATWECGYCHQKNSQNLTYCTHCRRDKDVTPKIKCPSCEAQNSVNNDFCRVCNKPMYPEAVHQPKITQEEKTIVRLCAECTTENARDANFCKSCGHSLSDDESWFCPSCNINNEKDALFCIQCGKKRNG